MVSRVGVFSMSVCQGVPVSMDGSVTRSEFSTVSRIQRQTERGRESEKEKKTGRGRQRKRAHMRGCEAKRKRERKGEVEKETKTEGEWRSDTSRHRAHSTRSVHTARTCSGWDRIG